MAGRIGALRHRLVLERAERAGDGGGGANVTWVEEATVWAAIRPLSGGEAFEAGRRSGRHTHEITMRYRAGVDVSMRLRKGTRVFRILALEDVGERGRWLKALCEERDL